MIFLEKCRQIKKLNWPVGFGCLLKDYQVKILIMEEDPRQFLVKIADILDLVKIPYFVTGGMAILIWGRPRFTADIDIIVEMKLKDVNILVKHLSSFGETSYVDKEMIKEALANEGEFNFVHGDTGIKVDFWVMKKDAFGEAKLERRVGKDILGRTVYFSSPEDLILSKLEWRKLGAGEKHIIDADSVLKISGNKLDMDYIKKWVAKLGIVNEFKELMDWNAKWD